MTGKKRRQAGAGPTIAPPRRVRGLAGSKSLDNEADYQ
jgi:hypothetical protein